MIDSRKPEHVAAFDEFLMLRADFGPDDALLHAIGERAHVEAIL
jgi:hypothetical protein